VTTQEDLAAYFERQAQWRNRRANEYPFDGRNEQSAAGLLALAEYVRSLPDDHPCIQATRAYDVHFPDRLPHSGLDTGSASYPAARIGFGSREPFDARRELCRYVEQGLADQVGYSGGDSEAATDDEVAGLRDALEGFQAWLAAEGLSR
jgi:hypothetical protein